MKKKAPWISIEGVDGAGKSSHVADIVKFLEDLGYEVVSTREPGGTPLGERLREEIINTPMSLQTEILLNFAVRSEHLNQVINPSLDSGKAVVSDRFTDSTYVYQGCGSGGSLQDIETLEAMVHPSQQPDLTLLFDLPPEESLKRLSGTGKDPDKFESQDATYFARVRDGYLQRAQNDPDRFRVVSSIPALVDVKANVRQELEDFLVRFQSRPTPSKPRP